MDAPVADSNRSPSAALRSAVERIGSQSAMARMLGVTQPSISQWLRDAKPLPAEHVLTVERETGISRHALRPDLYPTDPPPPHATPSGADKWEHAR